MVITIRTLLATLILGLISVLFLPLMASAQSANAQLIIVTRTQNGTTPSSSGTVFVTGTGPSLSSTPSSSGTLSYASSFAPDTRVVTMVAGSYSVAATFPNASISYSSSCTGTLAAGEVRTCTVTSSGSGTGGNARVNVSVNVINDNGGTRTANDFIVTVSGQNANVSSFQGTSGSVQVSLGAGSYSIDASTSGNYTVSRTTDCSGTIMDGETRSCLITLNDYGTTNTNPGYLGRLSCTPSRQSAYLGNTVSFTAEGGNGVYTWVTADRTFTNVGSRLSAIFGTAGTQSVYVTSGYETASCVVDILSTGSVKGVQTQIPGLPNTGFGPNSLGTILALIAAFVAFPIAAFIGVTHVRKTASALFR
jgi:hypothetical protein